VAALTAANMAETAAMQAVNIAANCSNVPADSSATMTSR